ncbi:3D domain-containing protein [Paenibacillus lautus]|uniref:3D domain-containing protein n=1 Tax=Paenibacillus lautus TaxID=1401 RepID=UPI003D268687
MRLTIVSLVMCTIFAISLIEDQRSNRKEEVRFIDSYEYKSKNNKTNELIDVSIEENINSAEQYILFTLTAYTNGPESTGKNPGDPDYGVTASGKQTKENWTIAADPKVLPFGTKVYIDGVGERVVEDTGSAIKGHIIDVFINDLNEAKQFGRRKNVKVWIIQ